MTEILRITGPQILFHAKVIRISGDGGLNGRIERLTIRPGAIDMVRAEEGTTRVVLTIGDLDVVLVFESSEQRNSAVDLIDHAQCVVASTDSVIYG